MLMVIIITTVTTISIILFEYNFPSVYLIIKNTILAASVIIAHCNGYVHNSFDEILTKDLDERWDTIQDVRLELVTPELEHGFVAWQAIQSFNALLLYRQIHVLSFGWAMVFTCCHIGWRIC